MPRHKFKLGQSVEYLPNKLQMRASSGYYKITRLLPVEGRNQQYRIKSGSEPYERIAQESQLTLANSA
jgi:hypothetical protein